MLKSFRIHNEKINERTIKNTGLQQSMNELKDQIIVLIENIKTLLKDVYKTSEIVLDEE